MSEESHALPDFDTAAHALTGDEVCAFLSSPASGLTFSEARARLQHYGANALPRARPPSIVRVFLRQFASPLIYVLALAALVSLLIQEWHDAGFIAAVLLVNAIIGTAPETRVQTTLLNWHAQGSAPEDYVEGEGIGETLEPQSLYLDQLRRRHV